MSVGHYENFPVASLLLPRRLRLPVEIIYRFARSADDFADEGTDPPGDTNGSAEYRRHLVKVLVHRAAEEASRN